MSDPSTYDIHAPQLLARGFFPLSIGPGTKKPQHFVPSLNQYRDTTGWTHPARPPETSPQPGAGIGVRLGEQADGTYVVALDWDDAEAAIIAIKVWPPTVTKEGSADLPHSIDPRSQSPLGTLGAGAMRRYRS
jgi:hypothetical protein